MAPFLAEPKHTDQQRLSRRFDIELTDAILDHGRHGNMEVLAVSAPIGLEVTIAPSTIAYDILRIYAMYILDCPSGVNQQAH